MSGPLKGALAAIIADPDCCAASKAIARGAFAEDALAEMVATAQAAGDYGEPRCQPQDTAPRAIQGLIDNYSTAGANLLDWLDAADLAAMPSKRASEQQWRDWGSDVACRATFRALRQAKEAVSTKPTPSRVDATKPVISRPDEPARDAKPVWYRGWECAFDGEAASWGCDGWVAYLGGPDLDCIHTSARTWSELLDEIDDHDETEWEA